MRSADGFTLGQIIEGHEHNFDHTSIFFIGRWRWEKWLPAAKEDGTRVQDSEGNDVWLKILDKEIEAPGYLLIEAKARHQFTFLGVSTPDWMIPFIIPEKLEEFKTMMEKTKGKAWCVYSHRTAQGDVVQEAHSYSAYV